MVAPTSVRNTAQSGPLDIAVRYSVLLGVVTYVVGLMAEWATASRLGLALADFPLTDRRIFISGGTILLWVVLCVGLSVFVAAFLHRNGTYRWLPVAAVLLGPPFFWSVLWALRVYVTSQAHMKWRFLAYAVVVSWAATWTFLSSYEVLPPLLQLRQTALLVLIMVFLVLLSVQSGYLAAEILLRNPKVHLLISPDSVAGARQLGISFLEQPDGTPAQLSEEVRIVYIGERTLLIQLGNGRMVQYTRDKISGVVRHSQP